MAIPNPAIFWGIRFSASSYVLRVEVDGGTPENLTFPAAGTLDPATDYYMSGDGTAQDLVAMLEACIETHSLVTNATASLLTSFRVQTEINAGGTNMQVLWDNAATTLEKAVFGFLADTANEPAHIATNLPQGIWRPQSPLGSDTEDERPKLGGQTRSLSGAQRTSDFGAGKAERDVGWVLLTKPRVRTSGALSTEPKGPLEEAWHDSLKLGRTFRFCEDETDPATFELYTMRELDSPWRRERRDLTRWAVDLAMTKES